MEQLITIEIFGKPFTFKAEAEAERAEQVAEFLKKEIIKAEAEHPGKSSEAAKFAILILAALNIANENLELKSNLSSLMQHISDRSASLIRTLDAGFNKRMTNGQVDG